MDRYLVEIVYTEPDFDARRGLAPRPREGAFLVIAASEVHARRLGVEEFRAMARASSVGWHRAIVRVEARRVGGDA